jgi:hypothetical protein
MSDVPEPLVVRDQPPLLSTTVVVRGGAMARPSVSASAATNMADYGYYGISVFARDGVAAKDIWESTIEIAAPKYQKVRTATVGSILEAGFSLLPTWDEPHFDVVLPNLSDSTFAELERVFSPATKEPE